MSLRVLIVEDEYLVALNTEIELEQAGYRVVGIAPSVDAALRMVDEQSFDVAVLDVNLGGQHVRPVADKLRQRDIPFAYTTGYAGVLKKADGIGDAPVLSKPYSVEHLRQVIVHLTVADGATT